MLRNEYVVLRGPTYNTLWANSIMDQKNEQKRCWIVVGDVVELKTDKTQTGAVTSINAGAFATWVEVLWNDGRCYSVPIGEPVVALMVIAQQLWHTISFGLISDPMFQKATANCEQESRIWIGSGPWEQFPDLKIEHVSLLRNINEGGFSVGANDNSARGEQFGEETVLTCHIVAKDVMTTECKEPV